MVATPPDLLLLLLYLLLLVMMVMMMMMILLPPLSGVGPAVAAVGAWGLVRNCWGGCWTCIWHFLLYCGWLYQSPNGQHLKIHGIMPDVHKIADLALQCMFDGHLRSAVIVVLRHV